MGAEIEGTGGSGAEVRLETGGEGAEAVDTGAESVDTGTEGVEASDEGASGGGSDDDAPTTEPDRSGDDAETGEIAADDGGEDEDPAWNGEISALHKHGWYSGLDGKTQKTIENGLDRIRRNMDRAFHTKMQEVSEQRDALMEREKLLVELMSDDRDFQGTIDDLVDHVLEERLAERTEELTAKIKELEDASSGVADAGELAEAKQRLEALESEKEDLAAERDRLLDKVNTYEEFAEQARQSEVNMMVEETTSFLETNAPDVLEDHERLDYFFALPSSCESAEGNELALKMLRIAFPAPTPDAEPDKPAEDVPDSVDMMSNGGPANPAEATSHGSWNDIQEEIRREKIRQGRVL